MKLNKGEKIFLDEARTKVSLVNEYLSCKNGVVELFEYSNMSKYERRTRLFLCRKIIDVIFTEETNIVRQIWNSKNQEWVENEMKFDSNSIIFLHGLLGGYHFISGGKYSKIKDYRI